MTKKMKNSSIEIRKSRKKSKTFEFENFELTVAKWNILTRWKREENNKGLEREVGRDKTSFPPRLEFMVWRVSHNIAQINKELLRKKDFKKGDVVLDLLDQKNKLEWPIRMARVALTLFGAGGRSDLHLFGSVQLKNGLSDCSEIFWLFLNSNS